MYKPAWANLNFTIPILWDIAKNILLMDVLLVVQERFLKGMK
jgi:hypothetical protein